MLLYFLAFVGGILTIVSPCILPVLPFVFSRADQPFRRSGLPSSPGPSKRRDALRLVVLIVDRMKLGQHALMQDSRN
jgi:cytochrome c biogenesis protein CcdA